MNTAITCIEFDSSSKTRNITSFRGAIIKMFSAGDILFHNHDGDAVVYTYPLIQYKTLNKHLALVGINEGAQSLESRWRIGQEFELNIAGKPTRLMVRSIQSQCFLPAFNNKERNHYVIKNWLPFNQQNFIEYKEAHTLQERINLLSRVLVGNILSLYKGLGYWIEDEIRADIVEILKTSTIKYKGAELISFDIKISTNISLPEHCGLGKGVSKGYGTIAQR
jgi:hypothetical protein